MDANVGANDHSPLRRCDNNIFHTHVIPTTPLTKPKNRDTNKPATQKSPKTNLRGFYLKNFMEDKLHHRKSTRLSGYDYSLPGAYFLTLRNNHKILFGELKNGKMILNDFGKIIQNEWLKSQTIRQEIFLDDFVILPNHFHAIVWIVGSNATDNNVNADGNTDVGANDHSPLRSRPDRVDGPIWPPNPQPNSFRMRPKSISSLITGFKSITTTTINQISGHFGSIWQRSFNDRIIRDKIELFNKRNYIFNNPMKHWLQQNS